MPKFYGLGPGFVERIAGDFPHLYASSGHDHNSLLNREIAEPQKLLPHLLQPNVSLLAPEIIGAYLQAAVKLFGAWAMELSQNWDNERLREVREVVDMLISQLKTFTSHYEIDVQERVRQIYALQNFAVEIDCFRLQTLCNCSLSSMPISHRFVRKKTRLLVFLSRGPARTLPTQRACY